MREETVQPEIPNPDGTGPVLCTLQYRCAAMKAVYTVHAHTHNKVLQQTFTTKTRSLYLVPINQFAGV